MCNSPSLENEYVCVVVFCNCIMGINLNHRKLITLDRRELYEPASTFMLLAFY